MTTLKKQIEHENRMSEMGSEKVKENISELTDNNPLVQKLILGCFERLEKGIIAETVQLNAKSRNPGILAKVQKYGLKCVFEKKKIDGTVESVRGKLTSEIISFLTLRALFINFQHGTTLFTNGLPVVTFGSHVGSLINDALFDIELSNSEMIRIGSTIINILAKSVPDWFVIDYDFNKKTDRHKSYILRTTDEFRNMVEEFVDDLAFFSNIKTPMIFKPSEWNSTSDDGGGYYTEPFKTTMIKRNKKRNISDIMINGVNAIQSSPWFVDDENLKLMLEMDDCPPSSLEKFFPSKPARLKESKPVFEVEGERVKWDDLSEHQKAKIRDFNAKNEMFIKKTQAKLSKDLSRTNSITQAIDFKDCPQIYFPHDCDYRGRIYNISQSGLSPQGDGVQKGLLQFNSCREIQTQEGENWLKYNIANHCGEDKLTLVDKLVWVNERTDLFKKIVSDPLKYTEWHEWDKPLEGLQSVREYVKYLEDPRTALNIHVQLDG